MIFTGKPRGGASLNTLRRVSFLSTLVLGCGMWVAVGGGTIHASTLQVELPNRASLIPQRPSADHASRITDHVSSDWKEIVSREGSFRITFPTEPKVGKKDLETAAGKLASHSYILEEGPISFFASWLEFPPQYVRRVGAVDILNGAKEAFFKRFKGKFDKERIIQLGAAPGRDVTYITEDDVRFRLRIFLRGNKLVQTMVMSEPEYIDSADANRFLDSLKWD